MAKLVLRGAVVRETLIDNYFSFPQVHYAKANFHSDIFNGILGGQVRPSRIGWHLTNNLDPPSFSRVNSLSLPKLPFQLNPLHQRLLLTPFCTLMHRMFLSLNSFFSWSFLLNYISFTNTLCRIFAEDFYTCNTNSAQSCQGMEERLTVKLFICPHLYPFCSSQFTASVYTNTPLGRLSIQSLWNAVRCAFHSSLTTQNYNFFLPLFKHSWTLPVKSRHCSMLFLLTPH